MTNNLLYFRMPSNFLSNSLEPVTLNGAMSTATITAVGSYDEIAITGGTNTSFIQLDKRIYTDANIKYRLRVKIVSLGSAPLIGIRRERIGNVANSANTQTATCNIASSAASFSSSFANPSFFSYLTGPTPFAAAGDIVDFIFEQDSKKGTISFRLINITNGNIIAKRSVETTIAVLGNYGSTPSIILADGTFRFLDFTIESLHTKKNQTLAIIGDSIGSGYNILAPDTLYYKALASLNNSVNLHADSGLYIQGMVEGTCKELLETTPRAVLVFDYLSMYLNATDPSDPDNAGFLANLTILMDTIKSYGGQPIMVKVPSNWPLSGFNQAYIAAWNNFIATGQAAYGWLILDLSQSLPTYDSSGYHYNGAFNEDINTALVNLLTVNNII